MKKKKEIAPKNYIDDNLETLNEPEISYQYADIGFHDDLMYYGNRLNDSTNFLVYSDKQIEFDKYQCPSCGLERQTSESPIKCPNPDCQRPGKWIRLFPTKKRLNINGYVGSIAPLWSKDYISEWGKGNLKLDKRKLYDELKDKINYFMDFGEKEFYAPVQACWVLGTYVYPLFYWFPHGFFKAPAGSGKSKNANVLMRLSFRGFDLGASGGVAPARIFRTLEGNRGTIFIDEFEKNDKSDSQKLVNQIINASASREAYIIRNVAEGKEKDWQPKKFPIFCPKLIANISGINPTTLSRCIPFELLRFSDKEKGNRQPERPEEMDKIVFLRNRIYPLMLEEWRNIKYWEKNVDVGSLSGREADNWRPILAIAKNIGDDIYDEIMDSIPKFQAIQLGSNDLAANLFSTIYDNVGDQKKPYTCKEIAGWMGDELSTYKRPSQWVGHRLREYNLKSLPRVGVGIRYELSKEIVKSILDKYFPNLDTSDTYTTLNTLNTLDTPEEEVIDGKSSSTYKLGVSNVSEPTKSRGAGENKLPFDERCLSWKTCQFYDEFGKFCGETPCNEFNGKYYCKLHFIEIQGSLTDAVQCPD